MHKRIAYAGIFFLVAGLTLRVLIPFLSGSSPRKGDGEEYYRYAFNLYRDGIYSDEIEQPLSPTSGKLPGTPLLIRAGISLFGPDSKLLILPNVLFSLFMLFISWKLYERSGGPELLKTVLWGIFCLLPVSDHYTAQFYPEEPAAALTLGGLYFIFCWDQNKQLRDFLLANLLLSLAVFFRPELFMTGLALSLVLMIQSESWKEKFFRALTFPFLLFLLLCPWMIRNWISTGQPDPLGGNFLIEKINRPHETQKCGSGLYLWLNTWHTKESHVKKSVWDFPSADLDALPEIAFSSAAEKESIRALQTGPYTCEKDSVLLAIAIETIRKNPLRYYLSLPLQRVFHLLIRTERTDSFQPSGISPALVQALWFLSALWSGVLVIGGLLMIALYFRKNLFLQVAGLSVFIRIVFFAWFYHVEHRYLLIFLPVLFASILISLPPKK